MAVSHESVVQAGEEGSNGRLCVYWDEYRTNRFLHIRYWYKDKSGQHKPGMKGIAIPEQNLPQVLQAIKQVLASNHGKEENKVG